MVSAGGGNQQALSPPDETDADPGRWSPDGNTVIFSGLPWSDVSQEKATSIRLLDLKTNRRWTLPGSAGFWEPDWSRDGRYVVALAAGMKKLMLYDFSTQKWAVLVEMPNNISNPTWSKDDSHISFNTIDAQEPAIYRVGRTNGKLEQIASLKGFRMSSVIFPTVNLAPDGSPVLLRDTGIEEIYALDLAAR